MRRQQLLRVEPRKNLVFCFEERGQISSTSTFRIRNNSSRSPVAFKVKTTDPPKFIGGPSYGILSPGSSRDVTVTVLGQVEALSNMQYGDKVLIKSFQASRNDTEESLPGLFRERERAAMVEDYELRVVYRNRRNHWDLLRNAIIFAFSCLIFWYITMEILSRIWTLIYAITILVLRMMGNRALDAAEDWIGNILLYLGLGFLTAVWEYVLDLCFRWLREIYDAVFDLCAYLFLFVFGPEERRPRYRN